MNKRGREPRPRRHLVPAGVPGLEPRLTGPEPVGLPITPYPNGIEPSGPVRPRSLADSARVSQPIRREGETACGRPARAVGRGHRGRLRVRDGFDADPGWPLYLARYAAWFGELVRAGRLKP
jgi:hypothetical protein